MKPPVTRDNADAPCRERSLGLAMLVNRHSLGVCIRERLAAPRLTPRLATKRSNSIASTPLVTAHVARAERDFRCTTIRRGRCHRVGAILARRSGCAERGL